MSRRFQFSLKWLFVAMLIVAAFFGGIHFERERRWLADQAAARAAKAKAISPLPAPIYIGPGGRMDGMVLPQPSVAPLEDSATDTNNSDTVPEKQASSGP